MIFIGLIGMMDPPRISVPNAINTCKNSGIKIVMITGDSINTARAIAKSVGIIDTDEGATTGKEIDKLTDDELKEAVKKYNVYARISPSTKLRIVDALQSNGYVVAMTGDGVNDAPAIQKADIGIGMGITGTEVVKKVADCILVDDSFSTIVDGVEEGRRITSNIKKIILYLLEGNIVEVLLVFISMVLNMEMFTTLQLLWINLVTDSIPAIMLAFEKKTEDQMENTPANKYNESFFTPLLTAKIVIGAIIKSIVMLIIFIYFAKKADVNTAGSLLFIYLVTHELLFSFSCRNIKKSVLNKNIFSNKKLTLGVFLILLVQVIVLVTPISKYFIVPNIKIYLKITGRLKMKNNNSTFIVLGGILVLSVFSFIVAKNILPDSDNNQYYARPNENMTAKIESITKENNKLIITTTGDPTEYCLKTTKSVPSIDSLCWNKIENNKVESNYFTYKKYYLWIKDSDNRISGRTTIEKE